MNITLITNELWPDVGGVGRYVDLLARSLADTNSVKVITNKKTSPDRNAPYKVLQIFNKQMSNPICFANSVIGMLFYLYKNPKSHYVYCCYGSILLGCVLNLIVKRRYVIVFHGTDFLRCCDHSKKLRFFKLIFNRFLKSSCNIVCVSNYVKNLVLSHEYGQALQSKIKVVYNSIDPSIFNSIDKVCQSRAKSGPLKLVSVGRLDRRKRLDLVIRALKLVERPVQFDIVGEGANREYLQDLVTDLGVSDRVIFHGRVSDDRLNELYSSADLCVVCAGRNGNAVEGFGLTILEAGVLNVPLLVLDVDGAGEVARLIDAMTVLPDSNSIAYSLDKFTKVAGNQMKAEEIIKNFSPALQAEAFVDILCASKKLSVKPCSA